MAKAAVDLSYKKQPNNQNLKHIPGNDGLPWIGRLIPLMNDFYGLMDEHHQKYGKVSRISLVGDQSLLCLGAQANKAIYLDANQNMSAEMGYKQSLGEFYGGGLLMRDFADHKMHRRMFQAAFKNDIMRHYTDVLNPVMQANILSWEKQTDFRFFPNIKTTLLDIAAEIFLGIDDIKGKEAAQMSKTFEQIADGMMGIVRVDSPWMFATKWRKGKQAKRFMENFLKSQIAERRASDKQDMFSLFTRETDPDGNYFSDDDIAAHINFLLFAAHDTTTSNLSYIMQYLGQNPKWQDRLRQQCIALGKEQLGFDDLNAIDDLQNVHLESLRLNPSVMMMVRRTINECEIEGVTIPANTLLSVPTQYVHRMSEYWDNPETFDPDRFSPERAEHKRDPMQFIPFGGGAHKCIGMHFAGMIVKTFLHQMLLTYEWTVPEGYNPKHQVFPMPKQQDNLPLILRRR